LLGLFPVAAEVAREVELLEQALDGNNIERAVIANEHFAAGCVSFFLLVHQSQHAKVCSYYLLHLVLQL